MDITTVMVHVCFTIMVKNNENKVDCVIFMSSYHKLYSHNEIQMMKKGNYSVRPIIPHKASIWGLTTSETYKKPGPDSVEGAEPERLRRLHPPKRRARTESPGPPRRSCTPLFSIRDVAPLFVEYIIAECNLHCN